MKAVTREMIFRTTDGKVFEGENAQSEAEAHQRRLNRIDEIRDYVAVKYPDATEGYRTRVTNIIADWESKSPVEEVANAEAA